MPSSSDTTCSAFRRRADAPPPSSPRTWVQLLVVDGQLSYEDPPDFARWVQSGTKPVFLPSQFRWAVLASFLAALPALAVAAVGMAHQPVLFYVPWFVCSLVAGLLPFYEVPGHLRVTMSAFVTVAALSTGGLPIAVACATIAALSSWATSLGRRKRVKVHFLAANWAVLVLSAAAGSLAFDRVLGLPGGAAFDVKVASSWFLIAFPVGSAVYVLVNTSLVSLGRAVLNGHPWLPTWRYCFSPIGLIFSIGILQTLSFIIAFGSWGALGAGTAGTVIAFLIILLLLGVGKQAVYQQEARQSIRCLAGLLRIATRPDHRKHALAVYFFEDLLVQGTRRFLPGIPTQELTFEAEEAVFDAEIAWKLGASVQSVRAYLTLHETSDGSGPFGLKEPPLPVWSPAFPESADALPPTWGEDREPKWSAAVLEDLSAAARPPFEDLDGENRKWNRLALSAARTIHSLLERYDYGRRLTTDEDLLWWQSCELAGFDAAASFEPSILRENLDPLADM